MREDYAGDISCSRAWEILESDAAATLVDVRSQPEWQFVGLPDLTALGKQTLCVGWQLYPDMRCNPGFVEELEAGGLGRDGPVLLLCRSGQRSRAAAIELTARGFRTCYNVAGGFEGPHDEEQHRGRRDGWKAADLPWRQG